MKQAMTIVGFGDSITEAACGMPDESKRWLSVLKVKLMAAFPSCDFKVVNSGVGGNSAREAMARFKSAILDHDPDWVILEFGGNNEDLARPERIVSPAEFEMLLAEYKKRLPSKTKTIIVTFPPVLDDLHGYGKNPAFAAHYQQHGGIDQTVEPYRKITHTFAKENGYPVFDLYQELLELGRATDRLNYTMADGVHLTEAGNVVLADGVFAVLKQKVL